MIDPFDHATFPLVFGSVEYSQRSLVLRLQFDRRGSAEAFARQRAQRATRDAIAPDYPCACGAAAGEYCETCEAIFSRPGVGCDAECTCDVCASHD